MRPSQVKVFSNSPNEHQRVGEAVPCPRGGESSCGGDTILQGSGNEAAGLMRLGQDGKRQLRGK